MEANLFLPAFRKMKFVDCNKPIFQKLMYRAFQNAKKQCDKWGDYQMNLAPFEPGKPIYYEFTHCPTAEFAQKHGLSEVMPALCNPDFVGMELIHARLVRRLSPWDSMEPSKDFPRRGGNYMDYRAEIVRMVGEIRAVGILKKIYKLTRMMWSAERHKNDKVGNDR